MILKVIGGKNHTRFSVLSLSLRTFEYYSRKNSSDNQIIKDSKDNKKPNWWMHSCLNTALSRYAIFGIVSLEISTECEKFGAPHLYINTVHPL